MIIVLVISLLIYASMVFFSRYRTVIATIGSGILLVFGALSNSFSANSAFQKFPTEIVILIIVLAIYTKVFENNGLFDDIGRVFIGVTKGRRMVFAALTPFTLYFTSLFMNNLSVILLLTFIFLEMAVKYKLPAAPLLVSSVIGSNIGGCPLPWADTPAVVLTLYSDYSLLDFLKQLFLPCLLYAILLSVYTVLWFKHEDKKKQEDSDRRKYLYFDMDVIQRNKPPYKSTPGPVQPKHGLPHHEPKLPPPEGHPQQSGLIYTHNDMQIVHHKSVPPPLHRPPDTPHKPEPPPPHFKPSPSGNNSIHKLSGERDYRSKKLPILLFILMILCICIAPFFNISIAYVSLFFGALVLLIVRDNPEDIITSLPILDSLLFISALFLIAATLEYSGVLKAFVDYLLVFTGNNLIMIVLCILVSAFIIATFLSAGPAAATLLPICQQLSPMVGHRIIYSALALGILAGSSMLPWSATGGPVLLSEVKRFLKKNRGAQTERDQILSVFDLKCYLSFSIPFSLIILILSGLILALYVITF